jgi:hypothetical protein
MLISFSYSSLASYSNETAPDLEEDRSELSAETCLRLQDASVGERITGAIVQRVPPEEKERKEGKERRERKELKA